MTPADAHRSTAAAFTATVRGVAPHAWDLPAPCEGWVARDVVRHLIDWFGGFLSATAGIDLPDGPSVDVDPVGAWQTRADAVQTLLDDQAVAGQEHEFGPMGRATLAQVVDRIYTADVFLHRWDLAVATDQDATLDAQRCAQMLAGMEPMDEALRSSGHYGPRVTVADDADPQTRLLAFIGRDPDWVRP